MSHEMLFKDQMQGLSAIQPEDRANFWARKKLRIDALNHALNERNVCEVQLQ